ILRSVLRGVLILFGREGRQFSHKSDNIPKQRVVMRWPPRRHAGHFDSVLQHPEFLRWSQVNAMTQFRRSWIEALADFGFRHARRQMTAAAHLTILCGPRRDPLRVAEIGGNGDVPSPYGNRAVP